MAATDTRSDRSTLDGTAEGNDPPPLTVVVQDLHVRFKVYEEHQLTLRELSHRGFRSRVGTSVHALRGVSFAIHAGDALGIVGSNGSGKSTLLRAVAGLQPPSAGTVLVRHKPHLLGVGSALKPMLSGRRNVYLGALAMGLSMQEIDASIDDVIEYSGLGDAINRPLKTYSSGMRSRLAFSIATIKTPEILLIDEALAVGDRRFRRRSLDRLNAIREQANTIVMVTHNVGEIRRTCTRCIWLERGEIIADGAVDDVLDLYTESDRSDEDE